MPRALTLAEAADRLKVTPQRISQMLRRGDLDGPILGPGRAPKGAGRVWEGSVQGEINKRLRGQRPATRRISASDGGQAAQSAREAAALEAMLRMKISLDGAREALREERLANIRLARLLAAVITELQRAQAQTDRVDNIANGYSDAFTQLLIPDDPKDAR
jgi:hypothetical protein